MKTILILIFTSIVLSGCKTIYTTESDGTATIVTNGFKLPLQIESYRRDYITAFDAAGYDVGAGYNFYSQEHQSALTVYIISIPSGSAPTKDEMHAYFESSKMEVLNAHNGATEINASTINGHDSKGRLQEFRYNDAFARSQQNVASFLAVFADENCLIKYRITGPESQRDAVYLGLISVIKTLTSVN